MKKTILTAVTLTGILVGGSALAAGAMHGSHTSPMHEELNHAMTSMHDEMHEGMMRQDADEAFAAGMIPHHKGAVEMARIELKYGKDPEMRQLAQDIIDSQQKEIEFMTKWLQNRAEAKH